MPVRDCFSKTINWPIALASSGLSLARWRRRLFSIEAALLACGLGSGRVPRDEPMLQPQHHAIKDEPVVSIDQDVDQDGRRLEEALGEHQGGTGAAAASDHLGRERDDQRHWHGHTPLKIYALVVGKTIR
jgi:hypothetical protein